MLKLMELMCNGGSNANLTPAHAPACPDSCLIRFHGDCLADQPPSPLHNHNRLPQVLCQARGSSTGAVLAELRALGCSGRALRQLYAGCGSAALCSAAIGAVYLLAFYSAKRVVAAAATTAAAAKQQQQQQQLVVAAGQPHERQRPAGKAGSGSQLADGSVAHLPLNSEGSHPLVSGNCAGRAWRPVGSLWAAAIQQRGCLVGGRHRVHANTRHPAPAPVSQVASLAGVIASLAGSVFEAPMEMFKLRTQVGRGQEAHWSVQGVGCWRRSAGLQPPRPVLSRTV